MIDEKDNGPFYFLILLSVMVVGFIALFIWDHSRDLEPNKYTRDCTRSETKLVPVAQPNSQVGGIKMGGGISMVPRTQCVEYGEYYLTNNWKEWSERQKLKVKKD